MRIRQFIQFLAAFLAMTGALWAQTADSPQLPAPSSAPFQTGLPMETARPVVLPSAQGTTLPLATATPSVPPPLYVEGRTVNEGRSATGVPAWAQRASALRYGNYPPFGANLFQGQFAGTYYEGTNQSYIIMPGDRILVHIWGAHSFSDTVMVDPQGNIFLPEVGPISVIGVTNGALQDHIRARIATVFRTNVEVYVNLLTAQPVAIYVTGFVARPGRYAGGVNDTALYYLDRAGGVIPDRGTYRDILIRRGDRTIAHVDLYAFILSGQIPGGPLQNGDTIVVGLKSGSVIAGGLIPQHASYESRGGFITGAELTDVAAPLPAASHVSVGGTRNANPFNIYMTLQEFASFTLEAGDQVDYHADKLGETIMVSISGAVQGATRYPIKRNTSLRTLLAYVPVDSHLANLPAIYIKRRSVVEQQKKAISDSLRRLENSVLTASSSTNDEALIRVQEAKLVQDFVQRVGRIEPDGVVVVTRGGHTSDIILEDGDEIVIPQRSDIVQISGEVMMPKSVVYVQGANVKKYILDAGGFSDRADSGNVLVIHPNGEVVEASDTTIMAGDLLLVMPRYDTKSLQIFKDVTQILYQLAIATHVVLDL